MSEEALQNTTEEGPADAQQTNLQIGDLEAVIKIIDHACEQGAFKGWQVCHEVFTVRNRLATFVAAVTPPAPESAETDAAPDAAPPAETASEVPEAPGAAK